MVTWGFLSTARINDAVLAGARLADRAHVAAVASRDCSRAQAYARERGIERAHGSYEALLADEDIEAVYISLPNSLHVEWSIRALEAGKHVLCEKPLSRHADEVERAFDAAERADRFLMEGFMYRHHPQTKRVAELVGLQLRARRARRRPHAARARRRLADGRRLLLRLVHTRALRGRRARARPVPDPGSPGSSCAEAARSSGSRSSRRIATSCNWRTSATRSAEEPTRCSGARTPLGRRGRLRRCTGLPRTEPRFRAERRGARARAREA